MIIVTFKQWVEGNKYHNGYYGEYTFVYENKSKLLEEINRWKNEGNPMIISGVWEL